MNYDYYVVTSNNDKVIVPKELLLSVSQIQTNNVYLLTESALSIILKRYLNIAVIGYLRNFQTEQYKKYLLNTYQFLDQIHFLNTNNEIIFNKINGIKKIELFENKFLELNQVKKLNEDNKYKYLFLLYNDSIVIVELDDIHFFLSDYIIKENLYPKTSTDNYTQIKGIFKIHHYQKIATFNQSKIKIYGLKLSLQQSNINFQLEENVLVKKEKIKNFEIMTVIDEQELYLLSKIDYENWQRLKRM